jgi:topoisomerase IV subunit A
MAKSKGVRLQRHGDGHLSDARVYADKEGLSVIDASGRTRVFDDLKDWQGMRAQAGRIRPKGFPTNGLMGPAFPNRL